MCGICGFVMRSGQVPRTELITGMMGRLAHRGPDGSGYYRDERAALGHTRLAIIDTSGGTQPLSNEDGRFWITFNGEIFNYVELGTELRSLGHELRTATDTEVIVHAWEQWGPGCFNKFNGQWAFALWDREESKLILSRDPSGIQPLFYADCDGKFIFASEIKAIFADSSVIRAFDPAGLAETFSFWCTVAPRTPFTGISELEPGHWAVVSDGTSMKTSAYWRPVFPSADEEDKRNLEENGKRLRERLIEATRLRFLRSDVPVGAYLSGGIDSSITAAIIARFTSAPLRTFSLRFTDEEFDEGAYQEEMVRKLGTEHSSIAVSSGDIAEVFPDVVWHGEKPILRAGPAPLYLLSRLVRRSGFKVVVTGEGSDEILAGYDIFREAKVRAFWARDPNSLKRTRAAELLYPWMVRSPVKAPSFARAFFGKNLNLSDPAFSHRPRWDSTSTILKILRKGLRESVESQKPDEELVDRMPPNSDWDPLARSQWLEFVTLLPGYLLSSQGDRMLMGHSVEGRFPFLDRDVIELANSLPASQKLLGLDEKHILKREFADLVPESILRRPKQPYRAPDASSFFNSAGREWIEETASPKKVADAGVFDADIVRSFFKKCADADGEHMSNTDNMRVLAILSTQLAHGFFIDGDGSGSHPCSPPAPISVFDMLRKQPKGGRDDRKKSIQPQYSGY